MISVLTGRNDARLLATVDVADVADRWLRELKIDVGEHFKSLGRLQYLECPTTEFRWYAPAEAAGGASLYEQLERFDWYYMSDKWEFRLALGLLKDVGSILEVGVGEGNFLKLARAEGCAVQGVELNPKGAARARAMGFEIHEISLGQLAIQIESRFDAICSFQVLEHVSAPREFIEDMLRCLKPGGRLILSVPNAEVMRNIDPHNQDLLNQPPHHMGHWDEQVFRALETLIPVKVKSVHREPMQDYHVGWMVNGYLRGRLSFLGSKLPKLVVNRYTTFPALWLMRAGLRKLFPGHTLLVELEYCP